MAEITAYPLGTPATDTLLVGTQMNVPQSDGTKANLTRNFPISQISSLITQDYVEVTKNISNAEWLALPTTGIAVVPAVTGKHIQVLSAYATFTSVAGDYFYFTSDLILTNRTSSPNLNSSQIQARIPQNLEGADDTVQTIFELEACQPNLLALYFSTLSTATNSGGGTVSITVRYTLI
tara:strand:+ start:47 stop:583 length:537 start_codon:yes stop_codon:yes gene_type:complete